MAADVLDRTALERASETITATLGPVDILINGARGNQPQATTGPDRTFFYLEMAAIRQVFDANVTATVRASIIPAVDTLRSLGIVFISGLVSGMLIAGANPIYAAEYQFATMAMLFAASTLTALIAGLLLRPTVFSPAEQLILHPSAQAQA